MSSWKLLWGCLKLKHEQTFSTFRSLYVKHSLLWKKWCTVIKKEAWIWYLALPFISCVTLGKLTNFSGAIFPHLKNEANKSILFLGYPSDMKNSVWKSQNSVPIRDRERKRLFLKNLVVGWDSHIHLIHSGNVLRLPACLHYLTEIPAYTPFRIVHCPHVSSP